MKITTTSVKQAANEVLDTKEKELYYLVLTTDKGDDKLVINIGQKTHDRVQELQQKEKGGKNEMASKVVK